MPSTTSRLALPYPVPADTVDVPRDVQALADRLDIVTGSAGATALTQAAVLDVGLSGQVRAGRQLTLADFTSIGLNAPAGLWNLSNLNDSSGNARPLVNKGAVPFGVGINGTASTAAQFAGSTGQALYIADTGAADPFRIRTGSWGCWFRTAKRGVSQRPIAKHATAAPNFSWGTQVLTTNVAQIDISMTGSDVAFASGVSDVADDRWHFLVGTTDGTTVQVYVDGVLEGAVAGGLIAATTAPLNIGGAAADAGTATQNAFYGRVDETFVTADVLSDDQVRLLYCARIAHGYATTPARVNINVRRLRRGGPFATTDFPTTPLRLHNFTAGALTDQGSGGVALTNNGGAGSIGAANGVAFNGFAFFGAQSLSATDAGLPSGTATRSYGCWFKTLNSAAYNGLIAWGTASHARLLVEQTTGAVRCDSTGDVLAGPYVADGRWHFAVMVEDNAAGDGVRRKLYLDGRLVAGSTVLNGITLLGANRFRIGADTDGTLATTGQIDGAFVTGVALTFEQIAALYAKGSQSLGLSPKNAGDHVEAMDATNVLATFDTLDSTHTVDMGVEA